MELPINWADDRQVRAVFTWQTRIGGAPTFGSRPIGWYQSHQCHAYDVIREACQRAVPDQTRWRVRSRQTDLDRVLEAYSVSRKQWIVLQSTRDVYRQADDRSRKAG